MSNGSLYERKEASTQDVALVDLTPRLTTLLTAVTAQPPLDHFISESTSKEKSGMPYYREK